MMNLEGFQVFFKSEIHKILQKYGHTEQARLLIGTYTLIFYLDPGRIPEILSKRTYYRHIGMLKDAGITLSDSMHQNLLSAYKAQE